MSEETSDIRHAALWLIGPDVPGLLNLGSKFVAERGGNIDKDIADKFGEKCVVFMSITASASGIRKMDADIEAFKSSSRCGVVFQPMKEPIVPDGFEPELHGFDVVMEDAPGIIAEMTDLLANFGMLIVGHTGERRRVPGPVAKYEGGQKYIVMLPLEFDHFGFTHAISELVKKHNGTMKTPLRTVPGLLWWW